MLDDYARPRLLICGSRQASDTLLDAARFAVYRANVNGWRVVVGDAPGVDTAVADACQEFGVVFAMWGIAERPRYPRLPVGVAYHQVNGNYLARDRAMVDGARFVLALWNGVSRGTRYTYDYAVKQGKTAWIRTFK